MRSSGLEQHVNVVPGSPPPLLLGLGPLDLGLSPGFLQPPTLHDVAEVFAATTGLAFTQAEFYVFHRTPTRRPTRCNAGAASLCAPSSSPWQGPRTPVGAFFT